MSPRLPSRSATPGLGAPRFAEEHPILTGAAIGSVVSLGIWYYGFVTSDYCDDPDFIPCEATIPIAVVGGGVIGGLAGYVVDGFR